MPNNNSLNSAMSFCHSEGISSNMNAKSNQDAQLAIDLSLALKSEEIKITLQPKVNLETYDICGYEVLLRWTHPIHGHIPADRWVMIAETNGLMPSLTLWLMNKIALLAQETPGDRSFAINVSPGCLTTDFAKILLNIYKKHEIPTSRIEIEITESTEILDYNELAQAIDLLRSKKVKVSLDDFGMGYASMRTLMELNVDEIKIDKSIVQSTKKSARTILNSFISLAREMDLTVVFEGIETQKHLNLAKSLGAHTAQGYLFGRPKSITETSTEHSCLEMAG